ncbi:hypothetical protein H072_757 [Dactylellina haptotyla CBS 200.50]|uniref:EamA domain-containing protein n=1 Tax=Dactylellina haptotyla (strain CBS 200.50) TaxID=1284197 RepID=S8AWC4_DACHA|nr:hypothetical protein H072_757 [Dactylellina haptotyla CBS 200.50]
MDHNTQHFNRPEYIEIPVPPSKGFNPHTNPAFFIYPDGSNMTFWFGQIDDFRRDQLFTNTIFSIQIGAALVILCVMFCVTHADKRKTIVYLLNVSNLFVVIIRGVFFVHYFMGGLARTYTTFTWDTSDVQQSEKATSIVSSICSLILMIGTQISLLLQVRICYALNPRSKTAILVTCGSISGIATTAYLLLGAYTIQLREKPPDMKFMKWAKPVVNALVALSIVSFSGIFSWRMFQSVRNRRRMGFTGIGSLESLLASGFQCLVFPGLVTTALTVAGSTWYIAVNLTTPSDLTAIYNCSAFFAYAFSIPLLKERAQVEKTISVVIAIAGVLVVAYGDGADDGSTSNGEKARLGGNVLIGIGSVLYGLYEVLYKKLLCPPSGASPGRSVVFSNTVCACIGAFTLLFLWIPLPLLHWSGWEIFELPTGKTAKLLGISIAANATFSGSFLILISLTGPVLSSVAALLTIFLVAITDRILFGRELTSAAILGGLLIIAAFALLSWATWKEMIEENEKDTIDSISDVGDHDD